MLEPFWVVMNGEMNHYCGGDPENVTKIEESFNEESFWFHPVGSTEDGSVKCKACGKIKETV